MEKMMEYLLEKMDWEKNDVIDAIYLINQIKGLLIDNQQTHEYIKQMIGSNIDNRMANKYIDVALKNIKTSELSSLLHISEMEAKYKVETDSFSAFEYEKLRNVGSIYMDRNR